MKLLLALFIMFFSFSTKAQTEVAIYTNYGTINLALYDTIVPNTVSNFVNLVSQKFYDGVIFHRVIDDFMAQTGDVQFGNSSNDNFDLRRAGTGNSDLPDLKEEFNDLPHVRGTLSMARTSDPNSANSQFFICFNDKASYLDRQYTVFGKVIEGMEFVDNIKRGEPASDPDKIISFKSQ